MSVRACADTCRCPARSSPPSSSVPRKRAPPKSTRITRNACSSRRDIAWLQRRELRHTQATLLIGSGADIKTVQQRLGHSSASLTMDIYAHFIAQNDRAAANTIGGILPEAGNKQEEPETPALSEADKATIAQRMADGASLEAAISAVRPDASVLDLLGL